VTPAGKETLQIGPPIGKRPALPVPRVFASENPGTRDLLAGGVATFADRWLSWLRFSRARRQAAESRTLAERGPGKDRASNQEALIR
jgi:hypothetical protein